MKVRLTEEELRAVVNLRDSHSFKILLGAIYSQTEKLNESLVRKRFSDANELYEVRGATNVLVELTEAINAAPTQLQKLKHKE